MKNLTQKKLSSWFRANYLDGDEIEHGGELSADFAFEAVQEAYKLGQEDKAHEKDVSWLQVCEREKKRVRKELREKIEKRFYKLFQENIVTERWKESIKWLRIDILKLLDNK